VRLWDFDSGKEVMTISSEDDINMVKFSPDGKYIAGACGNHNVYVWNVETGELVQTLEGLEDMVMTLDFSPDGMYLAAAGFDHNCTFKMWNTETAELVQTLGGRGPDIHEVLFTQDGQSIAVAYRTYGDLFEVPTIDVFSTVKVALETPWFKISSNNANLEIEFPSAVAEEVKSDSYYKYYDYALSQPGESYQLRAVQYLYDIDDFKRTTTIDKQGSKFSVGKTDVIKSDFDCDGCTGYIGVDLVGFKSNKRYHKRVVFVDSILYTITYVDFEKESNINETRFFDSFEVKH
jgi:WD40 repeat protein